MSARKILRGFAVAVLLIASYWSIRLAHADSLFRANTSASVARAAELDRGNARYHAWLAEIEEYEGGNPAAELETASALNPSDSAVWIRRGLYAESQRDFRRAEEYLRHAVDIDKLYAPRWALANYYARRGDLESFWPWARQALEMGYDDGSPLFRLCWSVSNDAELIRSRTIPPLHPVLGKYLAFLTRTDRLEAGESIARDLLAQAVPADTPVLLSYCDQAIEKQRTAAAVAVWNALFPSTALDPERGVVLTNGSFEREPLQQGFDWRAPSQEGVVVTRTRAPAVLRIRLSGKQAEHCELLAQVIPLTPGKSYRLRFEYETTLQGVRWSVGALARSAELNAAEWTPGEVTLSAGSESLARLALTYDRDPGAVRAEGEIWLRNVTIALSK